MKKEVLFLVVFFVLSSVFALCDESQIDINSASVSELDEIKWVGPATAEKIISSRYFGSIDELIEISGISDYRLEDIKLEGLACIGSSEEETEEKAEEAEKPKVFEIKSSNPEEEPMPEVIKLSNPDKDKNIGKDIKSVENNETLSKNDYAKYGFVVFCVLIGFLFFIKNRRNKGLV